MRPVRQQLFLVRGTYNDYCVDTTDPNRVPAEYLSHLGSGSHHTVKGLGCRSKITCSLLYLP